MTIAFATFLFKSFGDVDFEPGDLGVTDLELGDLAAAFALRAFCANALFCLSDSISDFGEVLCFSKPLALFQASFSALLMPFGDPVGDGDVTIAFATFLFKSFGLGDLELGKLGLGVLDFGKLGLGVLEFAFIVCLFNLR